MESILIFHISAVSPRETKLNCFPSPILHLKRWRKLIYWNEMFLLTHFLYFLSNCIACRVFCVWRCNVDDVTERYNSSFRTHEAVMLSRGKINMSIESWKFLSRLGRKSGMHEILFLYEITSKRCQTRIKLLLWTFIIHNAEIYVVYESCLWKFLLWQQKQNLIKLFLSLVSWRLWNSNLHLI